MSDFQNSKTFKKGLYGENIISNYLRAKKYVVYSPNYGQPHAFDLLAIRNKKEVIIAECKSKARRSYYCDTGINIKNYEEYLYMQKKHNIPVFIFFIDEGLGRIYGNFIDELVKPLEQPIGDCKLVKYPFRQDGIIYFPLTNMELIGDLENKDVECLKEYSTRNYGYRFN